MLENETARNILLVYLGAINLSAYLAFVIDKFRAIRGEWRIPEATLWIVSALGGAVGSLFGMYTARHKTRKPAFAYGMPLLAAAEAALAYLLFK